MPRIPQLPISKELPTSGFQLSVRPPVSKGVSPARGTQAVSSGKSFLAGGLRDVSKALDEVANYFSMKAEVTRVANSQRLQRGVKTFFRDMKVEDAKRVGDQSDGMLEEFQTKEDEFKELFISENLNFKTKTEVLKSFSQQYTGHAAWIANHMIAQSTVADNEARMLSMQDAREDVSNLDVGDLPNLNLAVEEVLRAELERHPNLTEQQIETNRRAVQEDLVNFALTKWMMDNPTAVVTFWDTQQDYIKKAIPKTYNVIAKKMDIARENSVYDIALSTVRRLTHGDNALAAKLIREDDKNVFNLTAKQRLSLAQSLQAIHSHEVSEKECIRKEKEEDFLLSNHEKYFDPKTGITNIRGALADLEKARRDEVVDSTTYTAQRVRLLRGGAFSAEDSHDLMNLIDQKQVNTKADILRIIAGTDARPEPYYQELAKRKKEIEAGLITNYYKEAYHKFTELSKIKKPIDLPSKIAKKDLLVSLIDLPDFKRKLEAKARRLGYTAGDERILDLADELLESGWYTKTGAKFISGKAPWHKIGEQYLRKWEFDVNELFQEGKIMRIPVEETATGVTLEMQEMLQSPEGPEVLRAIKRLEIEDIYVTPDTIKQAIDIIKREKEQK